MNIYASIVVSVILCLGSAEGAKVTVAKIQENGIFNSKSYLKLQSGVPRNLRDFTLCARLNLNYLRGQTNHWLSLGNETHDDLLTGVFVHNINGTWIRMRKFHPDIDDEVSIQLDDKTFKFQRWHHFCFVFRSFPEFPYPGGNINLTCKAYMDGDLKNEVTRIVRKTTYVEIDHGATLVLGQKQDLALPKDTYDATYSFSGRYAQVSLWRGELVDEEVESLSKCRRVSNQGIILSWNDVKEQYIYRKKQVRFEELDDEKELCKRDSLHGVALFNQGAPFPTYKFLCDKFGGQLPTFANDSERLRHYDAFSRLFKAHFKEVSCRLENPGDSDQQEEELLFIWTGYKKDTEQDENVFFNIYNGQAMSFDPNLWPGPASESIECTMTRGRNHLAKEKCASKLPCAVCTFEPEKRLILKGLCFHELQEDGDFDTEYYVSGLINEKPHFKGIRSSHIYFGNDQRWTLESLKNPEKKSKLTEGYSKTNYPLGRLTWAVENENTSRLGICNLSNDEEHLLTFSDCHPDKFTCSDGTCLPLAEKCDSVVQCSDGSDEVDCEFLLVREDYSKEKPPIRRDVKDPLKVFFSIDISAFPEVDLANSKLKSDYDLNLRWYDPRLRFRNLNSVPELNGLGEADRTHLWAPRLQFINALGRVGQTQRLDDSEATVTLAREETHSLPEDFSMSREARLFSGEKNSIKLSRRYSQDHACNFNLFYYPFDVQACAMVFELRDRTEDFIHFEMDAEPINYRGSRELTQYEIETESLEIGSNERNFSTAKVGVILRHRTEFHMVQTFVQTLVVLLAALATFFFDLDDFSDRVMCNAVLLLVMATISSSVHGIIPSTSYFKLIDVWLMFCIIMIVLVILLHTIIAFIFSTNRKANRIHSSSSRMHSPDTEDSGAAKLANMGAVVIFLLVLIIFNVVFWIIALKEYNMSAEEVMEEKINKPIR